MIFPCVSRLAALGWRYQVNLEQGLTKTYQWFLANQDSFRK
ncbi:GDP-L-fucose synthetase [Vibrio cholerae]|nr:GDP-L-fucose synthetase [Vibrio cholerae]